MNEVSFQFRSIPAMTAFRAVGPSCRLLMPTGRWGSEVDGEVKNLDGEIAKLPIAGRAIELARTPDHPESLLFSCEPALTSADDDDEPFWKTVLKGFGDLYSNMKNVTVPV